MGPGGDRVRTLIARLVFLHGNWYSRPRESSVPLQIVFPHVDPAVHRPLRAFDLGFQSGVPGNVTAFAAWFSGVSHP